MKNPAPFERPSSVVISAVLLPRTCLRPSSWSSDRAGGMSRS